MADGVVRHDFMVIGQQRDDVGPRTGGHHQAMQEEKRLTGRHGVGPRRAWRCCGVFIAILFRWAFRLVVRLETPLVCSM